MEPVTTMKCPKCSFGTDGSYPFCLTCGEPSPHMIARGAFAVELIEVPSASLREKAVELLRNWFPSLDPLATNRRLAKGTYTLVAGIDEQSARRIIAALRTLPVEGRLTAAGAQKNFLRLLWNGGLIWTAGAFGLALLLPGVLSLMLVVIGAAMPVGIAIKDSDRLSPIVAAGQVREHTEAWVNLARQYGSFITTLDQEDRRALASLIGSIFTLVRDLERGSLAAVAAGKERGDLYLQLFETAATAVEIGRRLSTHAAEEAPELRKELAELSRVVKETEDWFHAQNREQLKLARDFAVELEYVKESIDRILEGVRNPTQTPSAPQRDVELQPTFTTAQINPPETGGGKA